MQHRMQMLQSQSPFPPTPSMREQAVKHLAAHLHIRCPDGNVGIEQSSIKCIECSACIATLTVSTREAEKGSLVRAEGIKEDLRGHRACGHVGRSERLFQAMEVRMS